MSPEQTDAAPDPDGADGRPQFPPGTDSVVEFATKHPEVFKAIGESVVEERLKSRARRSTPAYLARLTARYEELSRPANFVPGQLVRWKPGLKNKRYPDYDEAVIVVEHSSDGFRNEQRDPASAYFREPLDLLLGLLDEGDEFITFYFDSRRFELVPIDATTGAATGAAAGAES